MILLEQVRTIDKSRLEEYIGHLDTRDMRAVNASLKISMDMDADFEWAYLGERQNQGLVIM